MKKIPFPSPYKKCDNQQAGWWHRKEPTSTVHKTDILPTPSHSSFLKTFAGFTTVVNQNKKF
jgi:hypothetical protein